ncbi:hypothetical protein M426DRAFT_188611 [Hypoxylon sp. CI-4A]|nr:hypothetical protein M426DRAFT_188611 [Hypoxylon sp. CI-4A]
MLTSSRWCDVTQPGLYKLQSCRFCNVTPRYGRYDAHLDRIARMRDARNGCYLVAYPRWHIDSCRWRQRGSWCMTMLHSMSRFVFSRNRIMSILSIQGRQRQCDVTLLGNASYRGLGNPLSALSASEVSSTRLRAKRLACIASEDVCDAI